MIIIGETLKPCPFCGEDGVMFEDYRFKHDPGEMWLVYGVQCSNPDCIMHQSQKFYSNEYSARRAWNQRKAD